MTPETALVEEHQGRILNRLRRLEGQVRGLQKMVVEGRECREILTLLSGVRSALDATGELVLEEYLEKCRGDFAEGRGNAAQLLEAVRLLRG